MYIHIVAPVTTRELVDESDLTPIARTDVLVKYSTLDVGPPSIESEYDEAFAVPDTVVKVIEAARAGADAIVIDCMADPGLSAAREATSTLVLGPAQTSMHLAAMLAQNFSIVTVLDSVVSSLTDLARKYGLSDRLCSIRSIDIPVLELVDHDRVLDALVDQSLSAVEEDGAHAIVLGCTGMRGLAGRLRDGLIAAGHADIPVIDPIQATFKLAEALADLGVIPSGRTYPSPRRKTIVGYEVPMTLGTAASEAL